MSFPIGIKGQLKKPFSLLIKEYANNILLENQRLNNKATK